MTQLFEKFGVQPVQSLKSQHEIPPAEPMTAPSSLPILHEQITLPETVISHHTFVVVSSRIFGTKIAICAGACMATIGLIKGAPLLDASLFGVLSGVFAGAGASAVYQMNLTDTWLQVFTIKKTWTRKFADPNVQKTVFTLAPTQAVEKYRPTVPHTEDNSESNRSIGRVVAQYEYNEDELTLLAKVCIIGDKFTRDPFYNAAPQYLRDSNDWKNFNRDVWPKLRVDLDRLGWIKNSCWTQTADDWFKSEGYKTGILSICTRKPKASVG